MEAIDRIQIYNRIAAKGLIGELLELVRKERPKVSRNTIRLSIHEGPTTPARQMILDKAMQVLKANEIPEPEMATA
jgi:hypothetical protein